MKAVLFAITLIASSAFAGSKTMNFPSIHGYRANLLCDAGSVFKTKNAVEICDQWTHTEDQNHGDIVVPGEWKCVASHMGVATVSKEIDVCAEYSHNDLEVGCIRWEKGIQGNKVIVECIEEKGEVTDVHYMNYTIPACN